MVNIEQIHAVWKLLTGEDLLVSEDLNSFTDLKITIAFHSYSNTDQLKKLPIARFPYVKLKSGRTVIQTGGMEGFFLPKPRVQ